MSDVKWIKIVTNIFDDEKIKYIERLPNGDETIVIWFRILCLAGRSNNNGLLMMTDKLAYTDDMLSSIFNRDLKSIQLALNIFKSLEMIEMIDNKIYLTNWEKHQNAEKMNLIKEQTRQRVAKYRQKQLECNANTVTQPLQDSYSNAIELDKELELDKEEEKKIKKKTYGTFKNVKLSELEFEKLSLDYPKLNINDLIEWFSAYIEEKGYKSKSHNLAIRRWVVDAFTKSNIRPNNQSKTGSMALDMLNELENENE